MEFRHGLGIFYAAVGTLFFATSPIFTLLIQGISPGGIAFLRMFLGSMFILAFAKLRGKRITIPGTDLKKFLLYGFIAAMHFLFYIYSLFYTTIAHSLSIVYTAPIFVTLLSSLVLKEPLPRYKYIGIGLVIIGIAVITGFEPLLSSRMIIGDMMALVSAFCFGLYSVAGRKERENYTLFQYTFWLYFFAAIFLLPFGAGSLKPDYLIKAAVPIIFLALLPTTLGHTMYNASVRHTHAAYSNLISTQEVTGGIILGYFVLNQVPGINTFLGCGIMFAGLGIVLIDRNPFSDISKKRKENAN